MFVFVFIAMNEIVKTSKGELCSLFNRHQYYVKRRTQDDRVTESCVN